jgi:hypothetical protein
MIKCMYILTPKEIRKNYEWLTLTETPQNLVKPKPGEVRNPTGRPRGSLDMATRIKRILGNEIDWDKIAINNVEDLKMRYGNSAVAEAMIWVQVTKALLGDTAAFNALRKAAYGDSVTLEPDMPQNVVHIYKPEKLKIAQIESIAKQLRDRAERQVAEEQSTVSVDLYPSRI